MKIVRRHVPPRGVDETAVVVVAGKKAGAPADATTAVDVGPGDVAKVLGGKKIGAAPVVPPPLPSRRLPRLVDAMADAAVAPLSPQEAVAVPPDILAALQNAKRVLVVGHVPPDGDCVGSALGLSQALLALGKEAVAVVDDELPAQSRAIDRGGEVKRFADVDGGLASFDCVVIVDVASAARVGAVGEALKLAQNVVVIDHHEVPANHEVLGLSPQCRLTTWVDPKADAAAVLVAGVAEALSSDAWGAAQRALAMAMYTDTLGFKAPGADMKTLRVFKGAVNDLDTLERALAPTLPEKAAAILDAVAPVVVDNVAHLVVTHAQFAAALAVAQEEDPRANAQDLRGHLAERVDALRDEHGLASLLIDEGDLVRVSLRSGEDGVARDVALALGGGGHPHSAATILSGSVDGAAARVKAAFAAALLQRTARLRLGRS